MQSSLVKCMRLVPKPNGSNNLCLIALQVNSVADPDCEFRVVIYFGPLDPDVIFEISGFKFSSFNSDSVQQF